jgi:hypothetical protein
VIAVVLRPVLVRPQCKPLLESGWAPSNPSDSKESRSLRTDTKHQSRPTDAQIVPGSFGCGHTLEPVARANACNG